MRRGVETTFSYSLSTDANESKLGVIFEQNDETVIEFDASRITVSDSLAVVSLTSDETLLFAPGMAHTQLVYYVDDPEQKLYTLASNVLGFYVKDSLGVKPYGIQD